MTKQILIFIFILAFTSVNAQLKLVKPTHPNADLNNTTLNVSGVPADSDLEFSLSVINTSSQAYTIKCRRTEVDVQTGTKNATCWVLCPPDVDAGDFPVFVIGQNGVEYTENMAAGDTAIGFSAKHKPNNLDGCSLYLYEFFDESDPNTALAKVYGRFTHNVSTSCTASLLENNNFEFSMYPNPANNQLTFNIDEPNLSIQMVDLLGKVVVNKTSLFNNKTIDVSNLNNGVYFVSVFNHGTVLKTEKLVVKH